MASPKVLNPVVLTPQSRQQPRVGRYPKTPFNLIFRPWDIQPFCLFPVLPGESLKQVHLEEQCWTDPLAAVTKNTGWTHEGALFYVSWSSLPGWEAATDGLGKDMRDMMVSGESQAGNVDSDGLAWTYCAPGGIDFVLEALKRVVECYYRNEGEAWDKQLSAAGVPVAAAHGPTSKNVLDKLTLASAYADRRQALDYDASGTITVDDMYLAMMHAGAIQDGTGPTMDYEDWLKASGGSGMVGTKDPERDNYHEPELLCKWRDWSMPSNTVEPTTGVPAVAQGWRFTKQVKQAFRFPEWGWILGVQLARPKVYYKNQEGLFAGMMQTRDNWFPPNLDGRQYEPHLLIDDATGPLKATMDAGNVDYWVDLRDLLNHGEQFLNYAPAAASAPVVTLPEADGDRRYPTNTDQMAVFSDTTNGRVRADGVISLTIAGQAVVHERLHNLTLGKA